MNCNNCGAPLSGEYCSVCGQRERGRELRMLDLAGEAFEDASHLDGRVWRTLGGLIFRPGRVTAQYLGGQRAHYLPPLRLYLVVSFIVFLLISLVPVEVSFSGDPSVDLEQVQQERGQGIYVPVERDDGVTELLTLAEYFAQQQEEDVQNTPAWLLPWLERLGENASRLEADPSAFFEQLLQRLPQMMFLLLPLFACLLQVAYLNTEFHFLQHLVFSLHYHTTAFVYYILFYPIAVFFPGDYGGIVILLLFIYLPVALVRVYQSGKAAAAAKGLAVGVTYYFIVLVAGMVYALVNLALM